ncbi:hypothetical protein MRX96_000445 [Rhipicephalus microplus]
MPDHGHLSLHDVNASSLFDLRARDPFRSQPLGAPGFEVVSGFEAATTSPLHSICHRRVDGYVGFSGATIKPLALGQEALAIAHRRHCAEVGTTRWPERASALGRWSR